MINPIKIYIGGAFVLFGCLLLVALYREVSKPVTKWWKSKR